MEQKSEAPLQPRIESAGVPGREVSLEEKVRAVTAALTEVRVGAATLPREQRLALEASRRSIRLARFHGEQVGFNPYIQRRRR